MSPIEYITRTPNALAQCLMIYFAFSLVSGILEALGRVCWRLCWRLCWYLYVARKHYGPRY